MGVAAGDVDIDEIGEVSSVDTSSWGAARRVSGEPPGESIFLLFAARVLRATGGVAVGA